MQTPPQLETSTGTGSPLSSLAITKPTLAYGLLVIEPFFKTAVPHNP